MNNSKSKTYQIQTLGCKANWSDSQSIEKSFLDKGWSPGLNVSPDVIVVNSCTVTDDAERQSIRLARSLKRKNPNAKIVFTGCSAEVDPEKLIKISEIDFLIGNQNKSKFAELLDDNIFNEESARAILGSVRSYRSIRSEHPLDREWTLPTNDFSLSTDSNTARTRAFFKIQEGCNSFCTYCVIPYGRGPSRSLRPKEIIEQINVLVESGVRELVITGTNIGDYGVDWNARGKALDDLLTLILFETDIERLRLSSLDPTEISDLMMTYAQDHPKFCAHFHVSLQSTSSKILRLMKRRYTQNEVTQCLKRLSQIELAGEKCFVGMDLITGFPGESESDFLKEIAFLEQSYWSRLHVFPYSERKGTPATRLGEAVPPHARKRRSREIQNLSLNRVKYFYQKELQTILKKSGFAESVLVEATGRGPDGTMGWYTGHTRNYLKVWGRSSGALSQIESESAEDLKNRIISAKVSSVGFSKTSGDAFLLA